MSSTVEPVSSPTYSTTAGKRPSLIHTSSFKSFDDSPKFSGRFTLLSQKSFEDTHALVLRITLDNEFWIVGLSDGSIKLYATNRDIGTHSYVLQAENERMPCTDIQPIPSAEKSKLLVAAYVSGYVRIWHYTAATSAKALVATMQEKYMDRTDYLRGSPHSGHYSALNQILACACSMDGERLLTGGDDCRIRVYDLNKRQCQRYCGSSFLKNKMDGHVMRICALKYHPRGLHSEEYKHIFISGSWDDTVQIWDDRYVHSLWLYHGPHIAGSDALDIDLQDNYILTTSWRRDKAILQVWQFNVEAVEGVGSKGDGFRNVVDSEPLQLTVASVPLSEIHQESNLSITRGYVARWLYPSHIVYGGSDENILKIIDRNTFSTVAKVTGLTSGVYSVAYTQYDDHSANPIKVAFVSGDKLYICKLAIM